ncbi:hypothetical protein [Streptomyces sp. RM72]|uniref:hypothetical protein n=1 Tax=Streptomyces sp. RM72 TaxID=1115510 RepID=UPI002494D54C|nr:hypothetical protein [Streptomyces sp. RM72]
MVSLGECRAVLSALGQGVGVHDAEEGFGLCVHLAFGPVQAGLGQAQAVFGAVEFEAFHGHRAHHESVVSAQAGFGGQGVELEVVALGEALLACVVAFPAQQVNAAAGGGEHLPADVVGAEPGPAQRCDVVAEVGDQGAASVVAAVAFVHLGEGVDHVAAAATSAMPTV